MFGTEVRIVVDLTLPCRPLGFEADPVTFGCRPSANITCPRSRRTVVQSSFRSGFIDTGDCMVGYDRTLRAHFLRRCSRISSSNPQDVHVAADQCIRTEPSKNAANSTAIATVDKNAFWQVRKMECLIDEITCSRPRILAPCGQVRSRSGSFRPTR
jgi:hypothetical protein